MYYNYTVKIPCSTSGISRKTIKGTTYVYYAYGRKYDSVKKYSVPHNTTIGKCVPDAPDLMYPNSNFIRFFPDAEVPEFDSNPDRSSCLRTGAYLVIKQIIEEYGLDKLIADVVPSGSGLFLDLAAYSIITENNAGQYYPDYAYNHPLFTENMKAYSDTTVSRFLNSLTRDQSFLFQDEWNDKNGKQNPIYVSYDSTSKLCNAGDLDLAEVGHAKEGKQLPIINFAVAYDTTNSIPLYYEGYSGSIVDVSQLQFMIDRAYAYHYRNICFILDRGYFSEPNIRYMRKCGYDYIIMMKGMKDLVKDLVLEVKGSFEEDYTYRIPQYKTSGITVKRKLFASDDKESYFHIYYKDGKKTAERDKLESKIDDIAMLLEKYEGKKYDFPKGFETYFSPSYSPNNPEIFLCATKQNDEITKAIMTCGYFVIITSKKMTAAEALAIYKSRDGSEKLFRGDKSYLGNHCYRGQTNESVYAKIFIEFVALIIRNRMYTCLKEHTAKTTKKRNFMNVVAAIKELEKIEIIRNPDGSHRMDHAVTATQKEILSAFNLTATDIKIRSLDIGKQLQAIDQEDK